MKNTDQPSQFSTKPERSHPAKEIIRNIVASQKHESEKRLIKALAAELKVSFLDCAAALAYFVHAQPTIEIGQVNLPVVKAPVQAVSPKIRLVRYRLALGQAQGATLEEIKRVLVEESGVDVNNIANVRIQGDYTLIDLPDEMPQEIYQHLKMVEINQYKLDIRRVKNRSRMRNKRKLRHEKNSYSTPVPVKGAEGQSGDKPFPTKDYSTVSTDS